MNRPTPNPSQEGSKRTSTPYQIPSGEGLGVGSWSQCALKKAPGLPMNRAPLTPSLSLAGGEGVRRTGEGDRHWFMVPMHARDERRLTMKAGFQSRNSLSRLRVKAARQSPRRHRRHDGHWIVRRKGLR